MKRFAALILSLLMLLSTVPAMADQPKPIEVIP